MTTDQQEVFNLFEIGNQPYTKFPRVKKKKNGKKKVRWIFAPEETLKTQQRQIMRNVLYRYATHPCAHAYVAQKNIRSGAFAHKDNQYTIVLDIKNFFPSITEEMVRKALSFYVDGSDNEVSNNFFTWNDNVPNILQSIPVTSSLPDETTALDLLVKLCVYEGVLPQGAPTSGALSNIVFYPLDCLFEQVSLDHDIAYTRYADDLTFSGKDLDQLKKIVFGYVFKRLEEFGFAINKKKVHVFTGDQRIVTGLNVHEEGVRPSRKYRRKLRARLANLRNKFSKCTTQEELLQTLAEAHYLRSEVGHYWYILYADTYSNGVEKIAGDYFCPIAYKIMEFFPDFALGDQTAFRKQLQNIKSSTSFYVNNLMRLNSELRKMMVSECVVKNRYLCKFYMPKIFALEHLTHREKREIISLAIAKDPLERFSTLNEKRFQAVYRLAGPEDKLPLILRTLQAKTAYRGVWYKICLYTSRLPYSERLAVARSFADNETVMTSLDSERFACRKALRKILRGISVLDLQEFVTCDHENLRVAAQDLIAFKVKRSGITANDDQPNLSINQDEQN